MKSQEQFDHETYYLIMFSQDRRDVLLLAEHTGFVLPSVEIPRWERVAENLTAATRSKYGCVAISLFSPQMIPPASHCKERRYKVMECQCVGAKHAGGAIWTSIHALTRDSFRDGADHHALERCIVESDSHEHHPSSLFARRGWFAELRRCVTDTIAHLQLQLSGAFCQLNASPSFSLIRFETNGPAVWFKAVGEPNQRELPVTLELARSFPDYLPKIIGMQPAWNGWLSLETRGTNLNETKEIKDWAAAAADLARLQVESIGNTASILEAGAHDARLASLEILVEPFLEAIAELMSRQTKVPPPALTREELALLGTRIQDSLTRLEELGIPDGLGHLDLNPGNIIVSATGCVFLDWAEGYVGHPFFSFEYLLEHFRRTTGGCAHMQSQLVASYYTPWDQVAPTTVIARCRQRIPLLAAFAYAVGTNLWRDQEGLQESSVGGYLRSLVRRMNKEAIQLGDGRAHA